MRVMRSGHQIQVSIHAAGFHAPILGVALLLAGLSGCGRDTDRPRSSGAAGETTVDVDPFGDRPDPRALTHQVVRPTGWYVNPAQGMPPTGNLRMNTRVLLITEGPRYSQVWTKDGLMVWVPTVNLAPIQTESLDRPAPTTPSEPSS